MDVSDEDCRHVVQPAIDRAQGGIQLARGVGEAPAAIDEDKPVRCVDRVDVDGSQRVVGQGQRYPVHTGGRFEAPGRPPVWARGYHRVAPVTFSSNMTLSSPMTAIRRPRILPTWARAAFHSSLARAASRAARSSKLRMEMPSQPCERSSRASKMSV